jgi:hypothetical protein
MQAIISKMLESCSKNVSNASESSEGEDDEDSVEYYDAEADRRPSIQASQVASAICQKEAFIRALPTCLLLTVGFNFMDNQRCFCPCGKKMKRWRERNDLQFIDAHGLACSGKNSGCFDSPSSLRQHLAAHAGDCFHPLVVEYLTLLYSN